MSCPCFPIKRFNNVNKSCKFIMGNPPIDQGLNSSQLVRPQCYQTLLEKSALVSYCQVTNQYKQRVSLSIYHTFTHAQLQCITKREEFFGTRERETIAIERSSYYFWGFSFGADSISEEVAGFSPLWFPQGKTLCSLSLVFDCCACYSIS